MWDSLLSTLKKKIQSKFQQKQKISVQLPVKKEPQKKIIQTKKSQKTLISQQNYYKGKKTLDIKQERSQPQMKKKKKYIQKKKNQQSSQPSVISETSDIKSQYSSRIYGRQNTSLLPQQKNNYQPYKNKAKYNSVFDMYQNHQVERYDEFQQSKIQRKPYDNNKKFDKKQQKFNSGNSYKNLQSNNRYQNQRSHTVKNLHQDLNEIKYQNRCRKFLIKQTYQKLDQNEQQLSLQIRKLKKLIFETKIVQSYQQKPKQITVYKSLEFPSIFIGYQYKGQQRYMNLLEINRAESMRKKIVDYHDIIKKIYDMHYYPVQFCYQSDLINFIKSKAAQKKIFLALKKKYRTDEKQFQNLFYYCLNKKDMVKFTFFDQNMKQITVGQAQIRQKRSQFKNQYQTFQNFIKSIRNTNDNQTMNFGQQQVQSDQQNYKNRHNNIKTKDLISQIKKTQNRLNQLLQKNITQLQQTLQTKNDELNELLSINFNTNDTHIQKLSQQVDDLNRNIQNFTNTKKQIQNKLRKLNKQNQQQYFIRLKMCLKRMIMASKQLDSKLPILGKKKQLFNLLQKNKLVILQGQTGSGKSTQLPQLLCQFYQLFQNLNAKPVLITQPRKIATRSLAQRVAQQLQQSGGQFVDYCTSGSKIINSKSKIIFKLDRLVLDELVISPNLQDYSCLVIDQAHQRTISIDVILGLIKNLLQNRNDFKVIITSASMQISLFEKYFKNMKYKTLKVSGRLFPVDIKYIDYSQQSDIVKKIQKTIDNQLLTHNMHLKQIFKGHILVFCSDTSQIQRLTDIYLKKLNKLIFKVFPLHGKLTPQDQRKVFQKTKQYKLIFASRIAQTAITIDGVKVVIDPGNDREMIYDQKTKFSSMKMKQISKSSAKQRAGRAGRTQEGYCFRLYSKVEFEKRDSNKLPQIKSIALETLILRLKTLGISNVFDFDYIQPPQKEGMLSSIQTLKMIGCLNEKQHITAIGMFLVQIPIQPFLARAIIEGILMQKTLQIYPQLDKKKNKLTQAIIQIICMVLSASNIFRIPQNYRQRGQFIKYKQFSHQKGDFFFLKNIYDEYKNRLNNRNQLRNWINQKFLINKTLIQVKDLIFQISGIIKKFKVDKNLMKNQIFQCKVKLSKYSNYQQRVLSCLTTSFCANLSLYSGNVSIGYTFMNQNKTMSIYGTSCLSLLGICPKWILAYDFYEGKQGKLFCKVANQVTFDFLKNTVSDYIYKKFNIQNCQNANPFYKQIKYDVQTLILTKIKNNFRWRDKKRESQFMKEMDIIFNQQQNKISVFIRCDNQKQKQKSQTQKRFQKQIQNIKDKVKNDYKHNYIGNIFVKITNGIIIQDIQFLNTKTVFQITNMDKELFDQLYSSFQFKIETYGNDKIKYYPDDQDEIQSFQKYLQFIKNFMNKNFISRKQIVDSRKKVPQTKIYLHWYAGKTSKQNVLLSYQDQDTTIRNLNYIQEAIADQERVRREQRVQRVLRGQRGQRGQNLINLFGRLNLTKNKTGINIWNSSYDQIEMRSKLLDLIKTMKINYNFKLPRSIRMFRQPQLPYCARKDNQWAEQINKLIQKTAGKKQNCLRVWGYPYYNNRGRQKDIKIGDYQKSFRVQMKAQIKTFDLNLLKRLQINYDGQRDVMGCQKLHIRSMFDQIIAVVDRKVFDNLWDQYVYNTDNFKIQFPTIIFEYIETKQKRNVLNTKIMIIVRSENRDDILKPMRILGELFSPKYISLTDTQFRYLDTKQGGEILYRLQEQFEYKIYFGFDRYQKKLKLYCHQNLLLQVNRILKQYLKCSNFHSETISYKGKNLKRIQNIIQTQKIKLKQIKITPDYYRYIAHEIKFTTRQIVLHGDIQSFNKVVKLINQVRGEKLNNKQCQICSSDMITPYKLFNCKHMFCWACLASIIRQFKQSNDKQLKCCYYLEDKKKSCMSNISIHDVATILSQEELQKICDVRISKFVQNNKRYTFCRSPNCQQIFDLNNLGKDNNLDCQLCGRSYCLKCGRTHKNYTCQEWNDSQNIDQKKLSQFGIKRCPVCKIGIQKNKGCNHITCKCNTHICWVCLKCFSDPKQCYDHLAKVCGGIMGPDAQ